MTSAATPAGLGLEVSDQVVGELNTRRRSFVAPSVPADKYEALSLGWIRVFHNFFASLALSARVPVPKTTTRGIGATHLCKSTSELVLSWVRF